MGSWDIDKLTGVLNRWGWDERAPATVAHALGHRQPIALLMVDLDSFKQINDSLGHVAGDTALRSVAAVLRDVTRASDLVGRFGGDEFVLLLPSTDLVDAMAVARRIRERLRAVTVSGPCAEDESPQSCSGSIGVAFADSGTDVDPDLGILLLDADTALLAAKRHGGDRTCVIQPWLEPDVDRCAETQLLFDPPLRDPPPSRR